uniref:Kinesin-associated protein 3a n=1 Tax=Oreochromis niloticus TaxID=8128 RepID=I3JLX8_ORENI
AKADTNVNLKGCTLVHPTDTALVVQYKVEATVLGELEEPKSVVQKDCQKIVNPETDSGSPPRSVVVNFQQFTTKEMIIKKAWEKKIVTLDGSRAVLRALARVLREDWKWSMDLATTIISVFFCFSSFSQFHGMITHVKIGSLCMKIIEYELKRYDLWQDDLQIKQEQFLRVALSLLLNLAEDTHTELNMRNKNIVHMLVKIVDREDNELLLVVITFLKKHSIFLECKNDNVEKLARLLPSDHKELLDATLRLLFNLSFDTSLRNQMVQAGFIPKLSSLLADEGQRQLSMSILYNISMDHKFRSMFADTNCIPQVRLANVHCQQSKTHTLASATNDIQELMYWGNAQLICEGNGLKMLMKQALKLKDALVMKMIRNLSQHDGPTKHLFLVHLAALISENKAEKFVVECLGTLANLTIPNVDWALVFKEYYLVPYLNDTLKPGGTCLSQPNRRMVFHEATRCDYQRHPYPFSTVKVSALSFCWSERHNTHDEEWGGEIQTEKFCLHNSKWLEMVGNHQVDEPTRHEGERIRYWDILKRPDLFYMSGTKGMT